MEEDVANKEIIGKSIGRVPNKVSNNWINLANQANNWKNNLEEGVVNKANNWENVTNNRQCRGGTGVLSRNC